MKAKLLGQPLVRLLGACRDEVPIYGSGGFTTYSKARLCEQLANWVEQAGCHAVKMKIGADPKADMDRVRTASDAIGAAQLFVDANGAYGRKQGTGVCRGRRGVAGDMVRRTSFER
ncbi:enolase C-terminal domain-like protein [Bradyrhizobium icense]|uniref:enolase C-terminal domain-like protein n=1 Tax=Bradyrhizobium icense TaxID=1274631 RepID=UPI00300174E3